MATLTGLDVERLEAFSAAFSGAVIVPGSDRYEEVRKVHNGLIDKRPAVARTSPGRVRRTQR